MTNFCQVSNNAYSTLASSYAAGSGSVTLAAGTGVLFGAPTTTNPIRICVVTASSYRTTNETLTIYSCTGRSTDMLTGLTTIEGTTDRAYAQSDAVELRWTAAGVTDLQTAVNNAENQKAPLASPALSGVPTAPTAAPGTSTVQLATCAFVAAAIPVASVFGRTGTVVAASGDYTVAQVTGAAPLASPALTGAPTAPTATAGTSTTQIATTQFVAAAIPVASVFGRTGTVVAQSGDYGVAQVTGAAPLASPTFTGTVILPSGTVTLPMMANLPASTLDGNPTPSSGPHTAITLAGGLAFSGGALTISGVTVPQGGTGLGTLTAHGVMLGEGTASPGFATVGTAGNVLTDNGATADPTFAAPAISSSVSSKLSAAYNLTTTAANITGFTVTLPVAGTYLIGGTLQAVLYWVSNTTAGSTMNAVFGLIDTTNSVTIISMTVLYGVMPVTGQMYNQQLTCSFGPYLYTVAGPTVIQGQGYYASPIVPTGAYFGVGSVLTAIRIK